MSNPTILIARKHWSPREVLKSYEDPGRKRGQSAGARVAGDLAELHKAIWLCPDCTHKFDWKRHHYYPVFKYEKTTISGNCDACKGYSQVCRFFLYEPSVPRAWVTKDENRRIRRHAIAIGG